MNEAVKEAVEMMERHIAEVEAMEAKIENEYGYGYEEDSWLVGDYKKAVSDWEDSDAWGIFEEEAPELWEKYDPTFHAHYEKVRQLQKEVEEFDYEAESRIQAGEAKYEMRAGK